MAGGGQARDAVRIEQGQAGDRPRLGPGCVQRGERGQGAAQGGQQGHEQGLQDLKPGARGRGFPACLSARGGVDFGRSGRMH